MTNNPVEGFEREWEEKIISVQKHKVLTAGMDSAKIAGHFGTLIRLLQQFNLRPEALYDFKGIVGGTVVNNDELESSKSLR